ncbi:glycerol-3-phosphate 1-O-acyltransferase PlsB [Cocleimonas flava]|uniref:Glycerol-3-phosphate acyltransferase n=1 Tax=Cocleimonas flava TaxID=634765 RepID=A0A4R1EQB6_9GAMM|nr:glycerol-3-phosphate 1-O-acyltransferase PlsB [Cocleimonas flava]TCJ83273.1 glycerol-3-phosphate acyltransferase [Cocleimonas flava]
MSLRTTFNYIGRKVLYLWLKTEVIPNKIEQLDINPDLPVIYVLETRSWTNLLVLEEQCHQLGLEAPLANIAIPELHEWHSVYTIAPREPFKAWLQNQPKRSRMLRGIIETLNDYPEQEIQFIPVQIFWGRPVATQKHWLQVLFSDSWEFAGRTRTFFRVLFHGRNTFIQYSEIISYRSNPSKKRNDDEIIDSLQHTLADRLKKIRTATLGPDISHKRTLVRDLIMKPAVQTAINRRSTEDNISEYKAALQARRYLNEIVANCTNVTIQVMQRALSSFWNRFYSGIEVNNSEYLKSLALSHELVYVPCHRSHIDYLLLSYVIYFEGLAIPYIAAGKNLNMPVIGSILRGGGAFFIRRSFKGNELYSTVMFEYVAELIAKGIAIEYFVEGGRSRTGRLLQAKPGMLSMTVRGFLKYRKRPVAFIPVYIGYEKLLESKAYQAELSGEDKKSETFINSVKSILKIRGEYGKVSTNFGKPVFLNNILDHQQPDWASTSYDDDSRPAWTRDIVVNLSEQIMTRINQAATVNSINLTASVLLAAPNQSMDEKDLEHQLETYKILINALEYSEKIIVTPRSGIDQIKHAESLKMVKRRAHDLGDIIYLNNKQAVSMTYYRNNILHLLALPSIISCCFFNVRTMTKEEIISLVSLAYPFIQKELFLSWDKTQLEAVITKVLDQLVASSLLIQNKDKQSYTRPSSNDKAYTQLTLLAKVISPVLEVYYLIVALLSRDSKQEQSTTISKQKLVDECILMSQRVAMIHEINSPDYSDKHLIANFIETLIHIDYLREFETEQLQYNEVFHKTDKRIRLLLPKQMRSNILQMIGE